MTDKVDRVPSSLRNTIVNLISQFHKNRINSFNDIDDYNMINILLKILYL